MAIPELFCPNGCCNLGRMEHQAVWACPGCLYAVTEFEIAANRGRDLQRLIDDRIIGRQGTIREDDRFVMVPRA